MPAHLLACLLCLPGQANGELDGLIAAHEATMAKIKSLLVECDTFQIQAGKPPEHTYHEIAAWDATRTRTRFEFPVTRLPDGSKRGLVCGDLLGDSRGVRSLVNWDERTGKQAAGSDDLRAEILLGRPKTHNWLRDPAEFLLQRVRINGDPWEVGDYLSRGSAVKVLPAVTENGRSLIPVSLNHPSFGVTAPGTGIKSTLFFAPDCGGLILKQVHDVPKGSGFTVPMRVESTVTDLKRMADGLLLPASTRHLMTSTGSGKQYRIEHIQQLVNLQINQDVPESAFDFRFPEGIVVKDRTQPGGILMHRWGAADAPAETWVEQAPVWAYALAAVEYGADTRVLNLIALLTAFVCLTAWFLIRRQRRKQQAAVTS